MLAGRATTFPGGVLLLPADVLLASADGDGRCIKGRAAVQPAVRQLALRGTVRGARVVSSAIFAAGEMGLPWWLLLVYLRHSVKVGPSAFNYNETTHWKDHFPMCGGPMQSPVSLTATRLALSRTPTLKFADGLEDGEVEFVNTGREIKLKLMPKNRKLPLLHLISYSKPTLGIYTFAQMHFHWGATPEEHGSEHSIGDKYTDAEAHFVFFNTRYGSFKDAVRHFDGLLVLGVMLEGSENKNQFFFPTLGMEKGVQHLAVPGGKFREKLDLSPVQDLLKRAVRRFYSYHGSLTTPPCNPVVSWMVSANPMAISGDFLRALRGRVFEDDDGNQLLVNNRRPVQPTHGRVITQHISIGV
ncbi:carbonic anhydrase 2-like [Amphibalanus amphitrite]|uniref:carbonic anhydrase 2-like n=1 Tax=Amphibalanus amphitrite TaxID=1232801 RepID=UPI001C8FAF2A|nr:carbonic anhydrase 2-like [Amphibalanus amphitrite]